MNCFKVLGVNEKSSFKEVKDAYYKKIKENPPEDKAEEFIKINNAFNEIKKILKEEVDLCDGLIQLKEKNNKESRKIIKRIALEIGKNNFIEKNEKIVETIKVLIKTNRLEEGLLLAFICEERFRELGLNNLGNAYRNLEKFIIKEV